VTWTATLNETLQLNSLFYSLKIEFKEHKTNTEIYTKKYPGK
jgi:hypothetical protein